jgi:hypothetical protein
LKLRDPAGEIVQLAAFEPRSADVNGDPRTARAHHRSSALHEVTSADDLVVRYGVNDRHGPIDPRICALDLRLRAGHRRGWNDRARARPGEASLARSCASVMRTTPSPQATTAPASSMARTVPLGGKAVPFAISSVAALAPNSFISTPSSVVKAPGFGSNARTAHAMTAAAASSRSRVIALDLRSERRQRFVLRALDDLSDVEQRERFDQRERAELRQAKLQLAIRLVVHDRRRDLQQNRAGVEPADHAHDRHAGLALAGANGGLNRRCAAPFGSTDA